MQRTLCFDDVLLVPQYSDIDSRSTINLSVTGFDEQFSSLTSFHPVLNCPIVASPMDTVVSPRVASTMNEFGGFAIIHRYCTVQQAVDMFVSSITYAGNVHDDKIPNIMVAIGATGDYIERAEALFHAGCRAFCIDVAHGHHSHVKNALSELRNRFGKDVHIMTGNVATLEAFNDLSDWGSDSIRVGIGGGSMCSTRIRTGHGIPTLQSVLDCAKSDKDVLIVADGGIRNSGDAVKALAAGADLVMLGSVLAGHDECPGEIVNAEGLVVPQINPEEKLYKRFRGMASKEAQLSWRGKVSVVEGESTLVPYKGALKDTVNNLLEGIRSGLSYSGARTIRELRTKAKFVSVTPQGTMENGPHGVLRA